MAYYLDERHRHIPGSKVKLVRDVLGFRDPAALRSALIAHARNNEATALPDQGHGARYNVSGPMIGPRGAIAVMVTGWIIAPGEFAPRNVTMFPAPKRGR